ncbi:hypothetical protein D3C85_1496550 [compost metagenome]
MTLQFPHAFDGFIFVKELAFPFVRRQLTALLHFFDNVPISVFFLLLGQEKVKHKPSAANRFVNERRLFLARIETKLESFMDKHWNHPSPNYSAYVLIYKPERNRFISHLLC